MREELTKSERQRILTFLVEYVALVERHQLEWSISGEDEVGYLSDFADDGTHYVIDTTDDDVAKWHIKRHNADEAKELEAKREANKAHLRECLEKEEEAKRQANKAHLRECLAQNK
jgi:hypothetical protein